MLINGEPGESVAALDRGLNYGDGLFETLAIIDGKPCLWQAHLERLSEGCRRLAIPAPDPRTLYDEVLRESHDNPRCVAKIIITRGTGGRGYRPPAQPAATRLVMVSDWPDHSLDARRQGARLRVCDTRLSRNPALAGIKHLNRLEQVMAANEWNTPSIDEGVMRDDRDFVIEGTRSNLFLLERNRLITPRLDQCGVAGVMRALVIETARAMNMEMEEEEISLERLLAAEGLFLTNSLIGIRPVVQLDGQRYDPGALPQKLLESVMTRGFTP